MSWKQICKDKNIRGLGIRGIEGFNLAFLRKWKWRLLTKKAIWYDVLTARCDNFEQLILDGICMEMSSLLLEKGLTPHYGILIGMVLISILCFLIYSVSRLKSERVSNMDAWINDSWV
ncbi:unnamed protein product [Lathyrus sativus]|nr:unnamed protein product [Lathyrus sativus]